MGHRLTRKRVVVASVIGAAVTVGLVAILQESQTGTCFSLGPNGQTRIASCEVRPEWATRSAVFAGLVAIVTIAAILVALDEAAIAVAGVGGTLGLAFGLGALFIHLWAPPATAENSSPPPEPALFVGGALLGLVVGIAGCSVALLLLARSRRTA